MGLSLRRNYLAFGFALSHGKCVPELLTLTLTLLLLFLRLSDSCIAAVISFSDALDA